MAETWRPALSATLVTFREKWRLINRTPPFGMAVNPLHEKYRAGFLATMIPIVLAGLAIAATGDLAEHLGASQSAAGIIGFLAGSLPLGLWRMSRQYAFHSRQEQPAFLPNEQMSFDDTPAKEAQRVPETKAEIMEAIRAETADIASGADHHCRIYRGPQIAAMVRGMADKSTVLYFDDDFLVCTIEARMSLLVPAMSLLVKTVETESPGSQVFFSMAAKGVAITNGDLDGRRQMPTPEVNEKERDKHIAEASEIIKLMGGALFKPTTPRLKGANFLLTCPGLRRPNKD